LFKKSAASVFLKIVKKTEEFGAHLPREMILFFRTLSILDMISLHISSRFDIIKALNYFFDKYPLEEIEKNIVEGEHMEEAGEKITPTTDLDWESFREIALLEKEKMLAAREKTIEMVLSYAEKYKELEPIIKKLR
jgi:predicted unusual protein kinase regulating ubiquinone biosynthesis (AarF/ABC1/UbiB family)